MNDTNHPVFVQEVEVDYLFENVQTLKFAVHDVDGDHTSILDDDGLGIYVTTLGQVSWLLHFSLIVSNKSLLYSRGGWENIFYGGPR